MYILILSRFLILSRINVVVFSAHLVRAIENTLQGHAHTEAYSGIVEQLYSYGLDCDKLRTQKYQYIDFDRWHHVVFEMKR